MRLRVQILVLASMALVPLACNTTPTQDGAVVGAALGAASGAIIGNQSGHSGNGALIGAGAGALVGALIGDQVDERGGGRTARATSYSAAPPVVSAPASPPGGHYETHVRVSPSGERYEDQVWVPN